jgi:tetratricopeptide (TPR) repeat protein
MILIAQDDATTGQVVLKNGYIYKNNVLFTGVLYSVESANNECKCILEANYSGGRLNGIRREWHTNGKIKFVGNYIDGRLIGTAEKYDFDGYIIIEKPFLSNEEMVLYCLKVFPRTEYTDDLLSHYLLMFDTNYNSYRNNQFEMERKKNSVRNSIIKKVRDIDFKRKYKAEGNFNLSNYSFDEERFNFKNLNLAKNIAGFSFYYKKQSFGNSFGGVDVFSNPLNLTFINSSDFLGLNIEKKSAELLSSTVVSQKIYYDIEYSILDITSQEIIANTKVHRSLRLPAFITIMRLYYDQNRINLFKTIYPKTSYNKVMSNYKTINNKINTTSAENASKLNNSPNVISKSNSLTSQNSTGLENLIKSAGSGDINAQNKLGVYYFDNKFIPKDITKAKFWFQKASNKGNVTSQENLGAIYFEEKDFQNAIIWYTKAANSNHPRAQYVLGFMHRKGIGTKKSRKKAKSWWKKSCALGYVESCQEIKKMNAFGNALLNTATESLLNGTN